MCDMDELLQLPEGAIGVITAINGGARILTENNELKTVEVGTPIFLNDEIQTAKETKLAFALTDETAITMESSARLIVDDFLWDEDNDTGSINVNVMTGGFAFQSGKVAGTSDDAMMITTPVMTVGVRGTKVVSKISSEGEESKIVLLKETDGSVGSVNVSTQTGSVLLNMPNQSTTIMSAFKAPASPIILTPADIFKDFGSSIVTLNRASSKVQGRDETDDDERTEEEEEQEEELKELEEESEELEEEQEELEEEAEELLEEEELLDEEGEKLEEELENIEEEAEELLEEAEALEEESEELLEEEEKLEEQEEELEEEKQELEEALEEASSFQEKQAIEEELEELEEEQEQLEEKQETLEEEIKVVEEKQEVVEEKQEVIEVKKEEIKEEIKVVAQKVEVVKEEKLEVLNIQKIETNNIDDAFEQLQEQYEIIDQQIMDGTLDWEDAEELFEELDESAVEIFEQFDVETDIYIEEEKIPDAIFVPKVETAPVEEVFEYEEEFYDFDGPVTFIGPNNEEIEVDADDLKAFDDAAMDVWEEYDELSTQSWEIYEKVENNEITWDEADELYDELDEQYDELDTKVEELFDIPYWTNEEWNESYEDQNNDDHHNQLEEDANILEDDINNLADEISNMENGAEKDKMEEEYMMMKEELEIMEDLAELEDALQNAESPEEADSILAKMDALFEEVNEVQDTLAQIDQDFQNMDDEEYAEYLDEPNWDDENPDEQDVDSEYFDNMPDDFYDDQEDNDNASEEEFLEMMSDKDGDGVPDYDATDPLFDEENQEYKVINDPNYENEVNWLADETNQDILQLI